MKKRRLPRKMKKRLKKIGIYKFWLQSDEYIKSIYVFIEKLCNRFKKINNSLMKVVDDDPQFKMVLNDISKGEKVATAFARHYGQETFTSLEGEPPDYEEYIKYKQERLKSEKL